MRKFLLLLIFHFIFFNSGAVNALQLANIFTDNMVLQQQQIVTIWGKAKVNSKVIVTFLNQTLATKTNENGDWLVTLSPLTARITSMIASGSEAGINVFEYFTVLQQAQDKVKASPERYLPWNYLQAI